MPSRVNPKDKKKPQFSFIVPIKINLVFSVATTDENAKKFKSLTEANNDEISEIYRKHIIEILQSYNKDINSIEEAFNQLDELKKLKHNLKSGFGEFIKGEDNYLTPIWENVHESYIDEFSKRGNNEK